jgi:hypothetical protein
MRKKTEVGQLVGAAFGPPLGVWHPVRVAGGFRFARTRVRAIHGRRRK